MITPKPFYTRLDILLSKMGEKYIWWMQLLAQLISFVFASIGIIFILWNVNFSTNQTVQLIAAVIGLVAFENIILLFIMRYTSPNLYGLLAEKSTQENSIKDSRKELLAWKEIVSFPWRFGIIAAITSVVLVVIPSSLFMFYAAGVSFSDSIHVALGGLLSAVVFVAVDSLLLEFLLTSPRLALLPNSLEEQVAGLSARTLNLRLQMFVATLIIVTLLMVMPRGYQEAVNAMSGGGGDLSTSLPNLQFQLSIIAVLALLFGIGYTSLLAWSITRPIAMLIESVKSVQKGNLHERAAIAGADDIGVLAAYFNIMVERLESFQIGLEALARERTVDLERKSTQLKIASQVAREAAAVKDPETLLTEVVDLISTKFGYYHAGIFLLDEIGEFAILQAASSEGGKRMLERGHRLEVGRQGIVGMAAFQNRARIAMDVGTDAVFFNNPDLPLTHSEAALPLSVSRKVIGVLDIQSTETGAFKPDDIDLLQTLADQITMAIHSSRLLSESQRALRQLEDITGENIRKVWGEQAKLNKQAVRYTPLGLKLGDAIHLSSNGAGLGNVLNIPITLRGQKIGSIVLKREDTAAWADSDRSLAFDIAGQVGLALENARLLDEARRHAAQEQTISELSVMFSRYLDPDILLQTAVRELHRLPDVAEVTVFLSPQESTTIPEDKPRLD